jgi:hypothetical protein
VHDKRRIKIQAEITPNPSYSRIFWPDMAYYDHAKTQSRRDINQFAKLMVDVSTGESNLPEGLPVAA